MYGKDFWVETFAPFTADDSLSAYGPGDEPAWVKAEKEQEAAA